jgi:hypothetical protein
MKKIIKIAALVLGYVSLSFGGAYATAEDLGLTSSTSPAQHIRAEIGRLEAGLGTRTALRELAALRVQLASLEGVSSPLTTTATPVTSSSLGGSMPCVLPVLTGPSGAVSSSSADQIISELNALHTGLHTRTNLARMTTLKTQLRALGQEWCAPIPTPIEVPVESTPVSVVRVQAVNPGDWTRSFTLASGAVFSRASGGITMSIGNLTMQTRGISLGRGSNTCGLIAPVDFNVNTQMSQEEFRRAVSGLGRIVSES